MKNIRVERFEVTISLKNGLKQKFVYEQWPEEENTLPFLKTLISQVNMFGDVDKIMSFTGNGIELLLSPAQVASLSVIQIEGRIVDVGL
jgi:hypothetical protein